MKTPTRLVEVRQKVLKQNDVVARELRQRYHDDGIFVVSLVSSPGSGKTAFLEKTLARFRPRLMIEVNPDALIRCGTSAENVIDALRARNYATYEATRRALRPFNRLPPSGKYLNVIALPKDGEPVSDKP